MLKRWQALPKVDNGLIEKFPEINSIVLQLLKNRHLDNNEAIESFLSPQYNEHLHDPFLFKQMDRAVSRIFEAVQRKEKVMVYGDYDADGVCSTAVMYSALKALGLDVDVYIPFRDSEGYGINKKAATQIIHQGFNLVVTVDCGVSNAAEIEMFNEKKIDVIVTDHHQEPLKLPQAYAVINPSVTGAGYPFTGLCGAGVAFKFVQALIIKQETIDSPVKLPPGFDKWLLDLVAVATISDMVPLIDENRVIVKYGLVVLEKTKRLGLKRIIEIIKNGSNAVVNTQMIGWRLAPRLNAAGRIKHASVAYDLLIEKDKTKVESLVEKLEVNNKNRQQITDKILKDALAQVAGKEEDFVLWAVGDDWPLGIVGLVAGRLTDKFHRPALVVTRAGDVYHGSGRSIDEFDITAALKQCDKLLDKFGGHPQACGFMLTGHDKFKQFQKKLLTVAKKNLKDVDLRPTIDIEVEVKLRDINWELWEEMEKFEPFGEGNLKPLFAAYNLKVEQVQTVGSDGKHLRVMVSQHDHPTVHKLIGFSFGEWCAKLKIGDKIDIVFELDLNEWNGNRELQLKIIDIKLSDSDK